MERNDKERRRIERSGKERERTERNAKELNVTDGISKKDKEEKERKTGKEKLRKNKK